MIKIVINHGHGIMQTPGAKSEDGMQQHPPRPMLGLRNDFVELGSKGSLVDEWVSSVIDREIAVYQPLLYLRRFHVVSEVRRGLQLIISPDETASRQLLI